MKYKFRLLILKVVHFSQESRHVIIRTERYLNIYFSDTPVLIVMLGYENNAKIFILIPLIIT